MFVCDLFIKQSNAKCFKKRGDLWTRKKTKAILIKELCANFLGVKIQTKIKNRE